MKPHTALAALALAITAPTWAACGSSGDTQPADAATDPPAVSVIEPDKSGEHRFDDLVFAAAQGLGRVDLVQFTGDTQDITYALFGRLDRYRVLSLYADDTTGEFCFHDTKRDVWFASHADLQNHRSVYLLGDGPQCSLLPDEAVAVIRSTKKGDLNQTKGTKVTKALLRAAFLAHSQAQQQVPQTSPRQ